MLYCNAGGEGVGVGGKCQNQEKGKLPGQQVFRRKDFKYIRMGQICSMGYIYKRKYLYVSTLLITLIDFDSDTFHIIRTHFLDYLDTFQIIQAHFIDYSDNLLDHPDTFSRSSGHFPHQLNTFFRLSRHFFRLSGYFLDYLDIFQINQNYF